MSSLRQWVWAIFIGGTWALFELLAGTVWRNRKQLRGQNWPISFGQVTKTRVFSDNHETTLTLSYTYPVADEPYPIPAEFEKEFYVTEDAQTWADALADKTIPVHVNPANSWKSKLLDSELESIVRASAASWTEN